MVVDTHSIMSCTLHPATQAVYRAAAIPGMNKKQNFKQYSTFRTIGNRASRTETYRDARKTVKQNERPHQTVEHAW